MRIVTRGILRSPSIHPSIHPSSDQRLNLAPVDFADGLRHMPVHLDVWLQHDERRAHHFRLLHRCSFPRRPIAYTVRGMTHHGAARTNRKQQPKRRSRCGGGGGLEVRVSATRRASDGLHVCTAVLTCVHILTSLNEKQARPELPAGTISVRLI